MKADAPGKLVLSGAYAVLRGAPAIVTAVDRRVYADTRVSPRFIAPEVTEGLKLLGSEQAPPDYDVSALRSEESKLGLGSSAAICVASLGAVLAERRPELSLLALREELYPLAREAHQVAQGGGSGIDVAAACFGGTLLAQLDPDDRRAAPRIRPVALPSDLTFEVWASETSASTSAFVKTVFDLETTKPEEFRKALLAQTEASERAADALSKQDSNAFLDALRGQLVALTEIGELAGLPIVSSSIQDLAAGLDGTSAFLPSGAGGGDVNLYVARNPSSESWRALARQAGLIHIPLRLSAEGLSVQSPQSTET